MPEKGWFVDLHQVEKLEPLTARADAIASRPYMELQIRKEGKLVLSLEKCESMTLSADGVEELIVALNKVDQTCESCAYFRQPLNTSMWGFCARVRHQGQPLFDLEKRNSPEEIPQTNKAFTSGGSNFVSCLNVRKDFGCNEWEKISDAKPE